MPESIYLAMLAAGLLPFNSQTGESIPSPFRLRADMQDIMPAFFEARPFLVEEAVGRGTAKDLYDLQSQEREKIINLRVFLDHPHLEMLAALLDITIQVRF